MLIFIIFYALSLAVFAYNVTKPRQINLTKVALVLHNSRSFLPALPLSSLCWKYL